MLSKESTKYSCEYVLDCIKFEEYVYYNMRVHILTV